MCRLLPRAILILLAAWVCPLAQAQLSLGSAVDMALQHSPRMRESQADLDKAREALTESRDAFIPTVGVSGGVGKSTGPPLSVPQVFTAAAQSLVFNSSQRDFIRSGAAALLAAQLTLAETRDSITEQVVNTYLALDNALRRRDATTLAAAAADRIQDMEQQRFAAGVDPHMAVLQANRTGLQLRLQTMTLNDDIDELRNHLSTLVGVQLGIFATVHESVPELRLGPSAVDDEGPLSPAVQAAEASAASHGWAARGNARYLYRPQLTFGANYSYVDTAFTNFSDYYGLFTRGSNNNPNALSFGVQVTVPLLDYAHRARARGAAAEAARARAEAEDATAQFLEGRKKTARAEQELQLRTQLSRDDRDIAEEQLQAVLLQLGAGTVIAPGAQLTPRDEQNARLALQQRTLDLLNAELQLQQTVVTLMRQKGSLQTWVHRASSQPADRLQGPHPPRLPVQLP